MKIRVAALAALTAVSALVSTAAFAGPVAVIGTVPGFDADVVSKLTATGRFSAVDYIDASANTPSLADLSAYSSVLIYGDDSFSDAIALGNNLDAYLHAGGGVVVGMFAVSDGGYGLADSNFVNDFAFTVDGFQGNASHLGLGTVHLPGDPVMAGVTSFDNGDSGYYNPGAALIGDAVDIADYSDGTILAAKRTIGGVETVDLNFYPPSSDARGDFWNAGTDGTTLLANALQAAGGQGAVPEPASWAMMVGGFGLLGGVLRRRKVAVRFA